MERITLVLDFVGQKPTYEQATQAVVAIAQAGCLISATDKIAIHMFSEEERAAIIANTIKTGKSKTVTVSLAKDDRAEKIVEALKQLING